MTLEETIQIMRESVKSAPNKMEYEKYKQDRLQLLVWLESYKTISESYPEVRKKIDRLEEENMSLLGSALRLGKRCEALEAEINRLQNEPYCEWKHNDEAMKLLGGAENAEN